MLRLSLGNIASSIERDITYGLQRNDFVRDENADRLVRAANELERCGVRAAFSNETRQLAWFVGGNEADIRTLQQKLNELRVAGGNLTVDGVYGKETAKAWAEFLNKLEHGTVPVLAWIDPLQANSTRIQPRQITSNGTTIFSLRDFSSRSLNPKGTTIFRPDIPDGTFPFYHINTVEGKTVKAGKYLPTDRQLAGMNNWNHAEITPGAYKVLKNFDSICKVIRVAGKVLLITGAVMDAYELGSTIEADLKDADKKLGKKTVSEIASIGGCWGGAWLGAKLGAMAGASVGTVFTPGLGTAIGGAVLGLLGGIVGAVGGDAFAKWIVDITYVEE